MILFLFRNHWYLECFFSSKNIQFLLKKMQYNCGKNMEFKKVGTHFFSKKNVIGYFDHFMVDSHHEWFNNEHQ